MIAFRQFYRGVHTLLYVVYHAAQVAVGNVGGDYDFPFHVLAADSVRSHCRAYFRYIVQRYLLSVAGIEHQVTYLFHLIPQIILYAYGEVETFSFFIYLGYGFAGKAYVDKLRKLRQGDAVFGKHFPFGSDDKLRTFNLLLHVQVGNAGNVLNGILYLIAQSEHAVQIVAEQLNGYIGFRTRQHGIDTVADRLADFHIGAYNCTQLFTYIGHQLAARTVLQLEWSFDFRYVHA